MRSAQTCGTPDGLFVEVVGSGRAMAIDRVRLAEALRTLLGERPNVEELPDRVCAACLQALPVDGVGLSLMTRSDTGDRMLLGASDTPGFRIEELQFELGEGPCVSAFADAQPVLVADLEDQQAQQRWPLFARRAPSTGVRAVFAFPLMVGMAGIGVLDCHRRQAGPLEDPGAALAVADAVTMALLNLQGRATPALFGQQAELFDVSWRSHSVVHQATGVLSAQLRITPTEALARLRARAFRDGRPLRQLADDIVAGRLDFAENEE